MYNLSDVYDMYDMNSLFDAANSYGASLDGGLTIFLFKLVALVAIVWGLANCFLGFKMQRVLTAVTAALSFGVAGGVVAAKFSNGTVGLLVGLVCAALFGWIAFRFYKQMLVFLFGAGGFLVGFLLGKAFSGSSSDVSSTIISIVIGVFIGVAVGFLTHKIYKPFIIITTAIFGGLIGGYALYAIFAYKGFVDFTTKAMTGLLGAFAGGGGQDSSSWLIIALILMVLGAIFQFKTAGRKIKDAFASIMSKETAAPNAAPSVAPIGNSSNPFIRIFYSPINQLVDVANIQYFFLGSAILALFSLLQGEGAVGMLCFLSVLAVFSVLFLGYTTVKIPDLAVNLIFAVAVLMNFIDLLVHFDGIYAILQVAFVEILLISLWLAVTKNKVGALPFVISGGIASLYFLITIIRTGGFANFISLTVICSSIPFALPYIKMLIAKYKARPDVSATTTAGTTTIAANEQTSAAGIKEEVFVQEAVVEDHFVQEAVVEDHFVQEAVVEDSFVEEAVAEDNFVQEVAVEDHFVEEAEPNKTTESNHAGLCGKCGNPLRAESRFCHACGAAVLKENDPV